MSAAIPTPPSPPTGARDPIVVATDGSEESVNAARWAASLAERLHTPLRVLDVLHQPSAEAAPDDVEQFKDEALQALHHRLETAGIVASEERAVIGHVVDVLTDASAEASLLVLGSAERVGWGRHGHFSLVHTLAHRVDCPIAVVPAGAWVDRSDVVVVGIDGSEASRHTLEWTRELATPAGLRVVAAFVVDPMYTSFTPPRNWLGPEEHDSLAESRDEAVELVERFGADPAIALEAIAADRSASFLVVGAKDRHSLGGALLGSIPDEILHHPTCPIVVVPHSLIAGRSHLTGRSTV